MIDINSLRTAPLELEAALKSKDPTIELAPLVELDERVRELKSEVESLAAKRNTVSKEVGALKRAGKDASEIIARMGHLGSEIAALQKELDAQEKKLTSALMRLPQPPMPDVPISHSENDNVEIRRWSEQPTFAFEPKHHLDLGTALGLFDFVRAAKITGSGWPLLTGKGAELEWALLNFMIDRQKKAGRTMALVPHLVRAETMYGVGQLPKFADQSYHIKDDDYDLYLVPTAEAAIGGLYANEVLPPGQLSEHWFAVSPCFRREAGAAGSNDRGLIRTHQFNKVEMFSFTTPHESEKTFECMVELATSILEELELPYRILELVTGDMPFSAAKTYDLEVWLPGQGRYYECSSISNCLDFQARRMKMRYRKEPGASPSFPHTLNGSGLATSRIFPAILENNQRADGSIAIPAVLRPYMGGLEVLALEATS